MPSLFFFFLFASLAVPIFSLFGKSQERGLAEIPTTISFPLGVVDIDETLSASDTALIIESINKLYSDMSLDIGVVVIPKMNRTGLSSEDGTLDASAAEFAKKLHEVYSLGRLGLLIFVADAVAVHRGSALLDLLGESELEMCMKKLKKKKGSAVLECIKSVSDHLESPPNKDKMNARRWGWTTWIVGLSTLVISGFMLLLFVDSIFGMSDDEKKN